MSKIDLEIQKISAKLLQTYDAKILQNKDIQIKSAFFSLSKKYYKKNTLFRLIYNYFTKVKPSIKYIAGPLHLTKHKQEKEENNLTIYTFGEIHRTFTDCPDQFTGERKILPSDMKNTNPNVLNIVEYIDKLLETTDCFLDIYIETPHLEKGTYLYYKNFKEEYQLHQLINYFKHCIELPSRKNIEKCKVARFHYIDIRDKPDIDNKILQFLTIARKFFNVNGEEIESENLITDNMIELLVINQRFLIEFLETIYLDKNTLENFVLEQFRNNKIIQKEINKSYLSNEITDFIISKLKVEVNKLYDVINSTKSVVLSYLDDFYEINEEFYYDFRKIYYIFTIFDSYGMDAYALARMFKHFNVKDNSQPTRPNNIIIYAGEEHSVRYREFFESINMQKVEESGKYTLKLNELKYTNCIDMNTINQPIFS